MNKVCASFARGDFSALAEAFRQAGFDVQQPLAGVVQICGAGPRPGLLISVGVHGDETAPIDMLALLLHELARAPQQLAVDLMLVIGNLEAVRQGRRFIEADLNRLFAVNRTQLNDTQEALRADRLMAQTAQFFAGHDSRWHLCLHTSICASYYPLFAIVPGNCTDAFARWLGSAGIQAVVHNPEASLTFSSYTNSHLGAVSCTAELGSIGAMGKNDLSQLARTGRAIQNLLRTGTVSQTAHSVSKPPMFRVVQVLMKHSDAFQFSLDGAIQNFTQYAPHSVIATDGAVTYVVGNEAEYVLFANPGVRTGLRAGLMVARVAEDRACCDHDANTAVS